jgi:iron complex outermembrane receptor protein
MDMFGGETKFAFAYNWTQTTVDRASENISDFRIRMLEDNLPATRYNLTTNHFNGDWRYLARVRYVGSTFEDHLDSGLPINIGSEVVFDAEVGYDITDNLNLVVGASNLFDNTPDENTEFDSEVAGSLFPTTAPIGINGGYYYVRATYTF